MHGQACACNSAAMALCQRQSMYTVAPAARVIHISLTCIQHQPMHFYDNNSEYLMASLYLYISRAVHGKVRSKE